MFGIDDIVALGMKIIDKVVPDPAQKIQAQQALAELQQRGELAQLASDTQLAQGQIDTNKIEAESEDNFTRRWRPFIGWSCGVAFAYHFTIQPFLAFIFAAVGHPVNLPVFDMSTLSTVLMGLLGLGGLRTAEKIKGVI